MNRQGFENTSCSVLVHHSFPLYLNRPTKLAINTKHSTLDFKRLVHWWHSKYFVALGTQHSHVQTIPREREDYYMLFTCVLKVQSIFETTCISQYICIDILDTHIDSNQHISQYISIWHFGHTHRFEPESSCSWGSVATICAIDVQYSHIGSALFVCKHDNF